jgi:hypothetical protein
MPGQDRHAMSSIAILAAPERHTVDPHRSSLGNYPLLVLGLSKPWGIPFIPAPSVSSNLKEFWDCFFPEPVPDESLLNLFPFWVRTAARGDPYLPLHQDFGAWCSLITSAFRTARVLAGRKLICCCVHLCLVVCECGENVRRTRHPARFWVVVPLWFQ